MEAWRLLRTGPAAPGLNMGLDQALMEDVTAGTALRLYAWQPAALSLGWFQPAEAFLAAARDADVVLVRRPTGGGAIHHDRELTFCITGTPGEDGYPAERRAAYTWVHGVLREALATLGVELDFRGGDAPLSTRPRDGTLCFEDITAFDLVDPAGRKVVGSAQRLREGRVLHHGSIPLEVPVLSPGAGSVSLAAGRPVGWDAVADAVTSAFGAALGLAPRPSEIRPAEQQRAEALAGALYSDLVRTGGG